MGRGSFVRSRRPPLGIHAAVPERATNHEPRATIGSEQIDRIDVEARAHAGRQLVGRGFQRLHHRVHRRVPARLEQELPARASAQLHQRRRRRTQEPQRLATAPDSGARPRRPGAARRRSSSAPAGRPRAPRAAWRTAETRALPDGAAPSGQSRRSRGPPRAPPRPSRGCRSAPTPDRLANPGPRVPQPAPAAGRCAPPRESPASPARCRRAPRPPASRPGSRGPWPPSACRSARSPRRARSRRASGQLRRVARPTSRSSRSTRAAGNVATHLLFDLLGAHPEPQERPSTLRTVLGQRRGVPAVVAEQPAPREVVRERDGAVGTRHRRARRRCRSRTSSARGGSRTGSPARRASSVSESASLSAGLSRLASRGSVAGGSWPVAGRSAGRRPPPWAAADRRCARAARAARTCRSARWRASPARAWREPSTTGQFALLRAHHRQIARVVAQLLVLLERGIVLLVDDQQPQLLHRREDRASGRPPPPAPHPSESDATRASRSRVLEAGVQHRHFVAEARAEAAHQLRRERDLRHQAQRAACPARATLAMARRYTSVFPRAGDAVEQERRESAGLERLLDRSQRAGLIARQLQRHSAGERAGARAVVSRFGGHPNATASRESLHGIARARHGAGELFQFGASAGLQVAEDRAHQGPAHLAVVGIGGARNRLDPGEHARAGLGRRAQLGQTRGQGAAQGLAERMSVVLRGPGDEPEHVGRERRLGIEHLEDRLGASPAAAWSRRRGRSRAPCRGQMERRCARPARACSRALPGWRRCTRRAPADRRPPGPGALRSSWTCVVRRMADGRPLVARGLVVRGSFGDIRLDSEGWMPRSTERTTSHGPRSVESERAPAAAPIWPC